MTCEVKNVMKFGVCNKENVGETGTYLRQRVTLHNQQIKDLKARTLSVSEHLSIRL